METDRRFYPYIVVGCGGVGSAAVYWLSRRAGSDVLGLEQFELGHSNGGSQDHSRIIRLAYHDDRYTKITPDTFKAWKEVEEESGIKLVYMTGGVQFAKRNEMGEVIDKYAKAMDANNIKYDRMKGSALRKRFPQFEIDDSYEAVYQPEAGLVDAAMANAVHIQLARGRGARVIDNCPVKGVERAKNGKITVHTAKGTFQCNRLVVAPGAWINHVLGSVGVHIPIYVTQEQVTYFATPNVKDFTKERYPIWIYHSPKYDFYGLPIHGNSGSKIGIDAGGPVVTAETRTYEPDKIREQNCIEHLKKTIPKSLGPLMYTKTCLYTMPPDRHFVIDTCAKTGFDDVIICCGAGHVYKFACLVGKILTEMAVDGKTQYDISRFNLDREALTNPNWNPVLFMGTGGKVPTPSTKNTSSKL
ncbi:monomeric sarcosine oxidase-like isoform X2 [Argopecten irradians]|uniref:monomeric sarcosine oxidase-like isoform X2 n=1 Tax=Argopecten irradians TaxID=31199 RepID=UPI0037112CB9